MEKRISSAKPAKTVTFLRRGKLGTAVIYHVRNGEDKIYQVSLHTDGDYSCSHLGTRCMALQYGQKCYHVKQCEQAETPLTFGKYKGKKFSELPRTYIRWLACHEKRLAESHRPIAKLAKRWLVETQAAEPVAEPVAVAAPVAEVAVVAAPVEEIIATVAEVAVVAAPVEEIIATVAKPEKPAKRYNEDARGHLYYRPFSLLR